MSTAAIVIIGNEVLSGKVRDENTPFLLTELRKQGVDVRRVHVIQDVIEVIADEVRTLSAAHDYVLTTGGVGPTHDDVTLEAVARAFDARLAVHPDLERRLRAALREREPNAYHLKMCMVPEGAEFVGEEDPWFPLVRMRNVYVFPGIPALLQSKFESARTCFQGTPFHLRRIWVDCFESEIAHALHEVLEEFPQLLLGSYPAVSRDADYRTMLTLESRDARYADRAFDSLLARLPAAHLLRSE
jgi:molybdenum cofactor synthesis domain-containing protein